MELHAAFAPDGSPRGAERASGRTKNIELDYRDTWRETLSKLRSQVSARKMMKNISAFSPKLLRVIKKNKKTGSWGREKRRAAADDSCILLRVGGLKSTRREWERLSEREPLAVEQITDVCGVHTDFMKLIIKAAAGGKGRGAETHEDRRGGKKKGGEWEMKIYVREEERADRSARVHVRMCVSMYIFMQQLSGCHFDFKGSVPPLWNSVGQLSSGLIFHTAAN